jgi:CBS domain-containing protein
MRTVAELMSQPVRTVTTDEVVGPIRDLMLDGRLHSVPVLDHGGRLAGIVTSSDLIEEWDPGLGVAAVMSDRVVTVSPASSVVDAAREMIDQRVHHLVVVQRDAVVGVISSFDLLHVLAGEVEVPATAKAPPGRHAEPGDHIVIRSHAIDTKERRGVVVEARGADGGPPFVVQWLDDPHGEPHDVLFFPGPDADIEAAAAGAAAERG